MPEAEKELPKKWLYKLLVNSKSTRITDASEGFFRQFKDTTKEQHCLLWDMDSLVPVFWTSCTVVEMGRKETVSEDKKRTERS